VVPAIELSLEIAKLAVAIVGAIFVAGYWNQQKHRLEQYRYLDEAYNGILQAYFDHPRFGQADLTRRYREAFTDDDYGRYHFFSMRVNTFLESIYDLSEGEIPPVWKHIFRHHAMLHHAWLQDHRDLHESGYVRHVVNLT